MHTDYCIDLNLNLKIFNSNLHPVDFIKTLPFWSDERFTKPTGNKHFRIPRDILDCTFIDFFKNYGLHLIGVEVFYTVPDGRMGIHSDVTSLGDVAKINWVYGGVDSLMHWYATNDTYIPGVISDKQGPGSTIVNSPDLRFVKSEVDRVHSQIVKSPSIVQVGCPHNITNGPTDRFCISAIFASIETRKRLTIAEAIGTFKEYLIPCL